MSMMHEIQIFSPVSPARWQNIKSALLAKSGVNITEDKGTAEGHGIKISYEFNLVTGELTLQTLDKPFYLSEVLVDQKIHDFVENTH
jgi:hypothetical protein